MRLLENMVLEAARAEGLKPSWANLPKDGSMVSRVRVDDDTGQKKTEWYGRESFIRDMNRTGRRILRIINPRSREILYGPPVDRLP